MLIEPAIWKTSPPVPVLQRPVREHVEVDNADLVVIRAALDAIPNAGEHELSYDEWRNAIFALHDATGGSDEGLTLAHEFSAKSSKYDGEFLDTRVWPYVRSERENAITVRTLYHMAAPYGFIDPTIAADFGDETAKVAATPLRFRFLQVGEFLQGKPPSWIVSGVIPDADLVVIYGESGSGKSFFALDLVACIVRGLPWREHRVTQCRAAYIAAEGANGFRNRIRAYQKANELPDLDLVVLPDAPNFMERGHINDVIVGLKAAGPVKLVVVDTLAQVMPGANENAGEDMGKVLGHCKAIRRATGAVVVLIHHSGKDATRGARGWSGLKGATDAEIEIVRADHDRVATITKMKDGEDGAEFGFKLQQVPVGADDAGEIITSCVVEATAAVARERRAKAIKGEKQKLVWQVVIDLLGLDGGQPTVTEVIDEAVNRIPFDTAEGKRDKRREHALRALDGLIASNRVVVAEGKVGVPDAE